MFLPTELCLPRHLSISPFIKGLVKIVYRVLLFFNFASDITFTVLFTTLIFVLVEIYIDSTKFNTTYLIC